MFVFWFLLLLLLFFESVLNSQFRHVYHPEISDQLDRCCRNNHCNLAILSCCKRRRSEFFKFDAFWWTKCPGCPSPHTLLFPPATSTINWLTFTFHPIFTRQGIMISYLYTISGQESVLKMLATWVCYCLPTNLNSLFNQNSMFIQFNEVHVMFTQCEIYYNWFHLILMEPNK